MKCLTEKNELAMFFHLSKKLTVYPYSHGVHKLTDTKRFCEQTNIDSVSLPLIPAFLF